MAIYFWVGHPSKDTELEGLVDTGSLPLGKPRESLSPVFHLINLILC